MKQANKAQISLEAIVEKAIELLNRDGIQKLSTRALAEAVGVKSASLYWHIKDKQDLYGHIAEKLCTEIQPVSGLGNAKGYLVETAGLYRKKLVSVRDSVEIFMRYPPVTPRRSELIKNVLICLLHLGIKEKNCLIAAHIFNNYILSFAADEQLLPPPQNTAANPLLDILGSGYEPVTLDEQFNVGLDVLFTGFKILE